MYSELSLNENLCWAKPFFKNRHLEFLHAALSFGPFLWGETCAETCAVIDLA